MPKIINLLLLVGGMIMAVFGLAAFHVAAILLGFGMIVVAFFSDRRRERREKEKRSADVARRIAELTQAPWHSHKTLKLDGSYRMAVGLMLGGFASALAIQKGITPDAVHWQRVLGGVLFLTLIAIALPRSLASLASHSWNLIGMGSPCQFTDQYPGEKSRASTFINSRIAG